MKNWSKSERVVFLTLLFWTAALVLHPQSVSAASVTLAWDANTPAPEGYRVFQRTDGQSYDYASPVWPVDDTHHTETACTIDGLTEGTNYYFVVRAYVGADQSGDSNEVQYLPPVTQPAEGDGGSGDPTVVVDDSVQPAPTEDPVVMDDTAQPAPTEDPVVVDDTAQPAPTEDPVVVDDTAQPAPTEDPIVVDDTVQPAPTEDPVVVDDTVQPAPTEDPVVVDDTVQPAPTEDPVVVDDTVQPAPTEDPVVVAPDISDSDTDNMAGLPTPVAPGDGTTSPPSLAILDNAFSHQGWLSVQWSAHVPSDAQSRVAMGDIDGDGRDEIIIGLGPVFDASLPGGLFQLIDDDYTLMGWGQIDWPDYNLANGESFPACADIDGDGDDEILLGLGAGGQGMVEVLDFQNGGVVHLDWITVDWPEYNGLAGQTHPAAGDIDADGKDEIIIGLGSDASDPQVPAGMFQILDDDFSELSWGEIGWLDYNESNGESYPTAGDMNGDGKASLLIGLGPGGGGRVETFQYNAGLVTHTGWITLDWDDYNQTIGQTRPATGDLDGDGREEIVVGLGAYPDDPDIPGGRFQILDDDATHLSWARIQWPEYNAVNGESFPVAGDINGDGMDDVFVGLGIQNALAADDSQPVVDTSPPASPGNENEGGGGGSGCFISIVWPTVD